MCATATLSLSGTVMKHDTDDLNSFEHMLEVDRGQPLNLGKLILAYIMQVCCMCIMVAIEAKPNT